MSKNKIFIIVLFIIIAIVSSYLYFSEDNVDNINNAKTSIDENNELKIVTSFYPVYIMTINVTKNANNVKVSNMADKLTTCIHDYTLSTEDLKNVENANIFIETKEGLEPFTDEITNLYKNIRVIDSGKNVDNLIIKEDGESNSHIWLSLDNYINQVNEIKNELIELDSNNKDIYEENSKQYIQKIDDLKQKYENLNFNGRKAISLNETLSYLLREVNIDETLIETDHNNSALSANEIKQIVDKMKEENINTIVLDKDDDMQNANMIAKETNAKIYKLNSAINGENSYDAYLNIMNENYSILKEIKENE